MSARTHSGVELRIGERDAQRRVLERDAVRVLAHGSLEQHVQRLGVGARVHARRWVWLSSKLAHSAYCTVEGTTISFLCRCCERREVGVVANSEQQQHVVSAFVRLPTTPPAPSLD